MTDRLSKQMAFINEIEKLKVVYRRNRTVDQTRPENSAEHSWHVALMALVLAEHANAESVDMFKVIRMLLIHDLVEIYAGDTWLYDAEATRKQGVQETLAAAKLFALLPNDQADEFRCLWEEFASRSSPEATYAAAIDALQPLSNNLLTGDATADGVCPAKDEVLVRKKHIHRGSKTLWHLAQELIDESTKKGLYT